MRLVIFFSFVLFVLGCKSEKKAPKEDIASLEAKLSKAPDQATLQKLMIRYQEEAANTSGAQKLEYLWKAGETARAVQKFDVAEASFKEIYEQHPDSEEASKALFLHAFMCDEDLQQFDKARGLYQAFIEKYPNSDFQDDALFLLEHLGKSDEEMLELLSKKNQEN